MSKLRLPQQLDTATILAFVAEEYGVPAAYITARFYTTAARLSTARSIATYLCKELTGFTNAELGPIFQRDVSSISVRICKVRRDMERSEATRDYINRCLRTLSGEQRERKER